MNPCYLRRLERGEYSRLGSERRPASSLRGLGSQRVLILVRRVMLHSLSLHVTPIMQFLPCEWRLSRLVHNPCRGLCEPLCRWLPCRQSLQCKWDPCTQGQFSLADAQPWVEAGVVVWHLCGARLCHLQAIAWLDKRSGQWKEILNWAQGKLMIRTSFPTEGHTGQPANWLTEPTGEVAWRSVGDCRAATLEGLDPVWIMGSLQLCRWSLPYPHLPQYIDSSLVKVSRLCN